MIEELEFTNFKTWAKAKLKFGKITALFGTNSSGKTSLIQFLLLLKQTKEATDRAVAFTLNGNYVNLGVYKDLVYGHDESKMIDWKLGFSIGSELALVDPSGKRTDAFAQGSNLRVHNRVRLAQNTLKSEYLSYSLGETDFILSAKSSGAKEYELTTNHSDFKFLRTQGRAWKLPGPVKSYAFPDQARTYFQNASFLSELEAAFEKQLDDLYYLGPLREFPQRDYLWARSRPRDVGSKGEKAIDAILAATEAGEQRNYRKGARLRPFQEMIAYWLREIGLIHDFKVEEIRKGSNRWQAILEVRKGSPSVLLTDVGFGVSQVLPVITLLLYVPEGSTVVLEQPEIHLHPLAQANLADVLIYAAINRNIQIVLESHSEHLLLRLQRRIAEQSIASSDVNLYFCDVPKVESALLPLEIDLLGSIRNWPKNFMGDSMGELFAAEEARLKRRIAPSE
jgi:predicted ATPase